MFRINYMRPEEMPPHQRDFPRREQLEEISGTTGSRTLLLMVAWYLVAMFAGTLLLGHLTALAPNTATATIGVMLNK
jgi:hypothetical protein